MPFGDRTGPMGLGPRTGRGAGYCSGFGMPGYANPVLGRGFYGFGRGWGRGRGWFGGGRGLRNRFWAAGMPGWPGYGYPYGAGLTAQEEIDMLRDHADLLKRELDEIQSRISKIEKSKGSENE
ncbi:MAG: DUF5320 domain-containing protein [Nitrospirae bacterium]|nr:DUF5320 domain-containing protein [Nitrospirota bacterium]